MRGIRNRLWLASGVVAVALWPGVAVAASSITGTITFSGTAPTLKPLTMDAAPECAKKHTAPVPSELLVLGKGNTMGNVMVYVSKGLAAGKTWPAPSAPAVLDQNGCQYKPHVMGIMVGQAYRILNSDGILHNIHTLPKINASFNKPMPATLKETTTTFNKAEPIFPIKCDVHGWMRAYVGALEHPYFAVTGDDGSFALPDLPPGTYTVEAWHERLGTQAKQVILGAKDSKDVDFTFAR